MDDQKNLSNENQNLGVPSAESQATVTENAAPSGVELIAAERARQMSEEGWTHEHDDRHWDQQLAQAAACYAWPEPRPVEVKKAWPWDREWWKPTIPANGAESTWRESVEARQHDLAKAGALIAAELDRIQRLLGRTNAARSAFYRR